MAESTSREKLRDAIILACLDHASFCRQKRISFVDKREHARALADHILLFVTDLGIDPRYDPLLEDENERTQ